MNQNRPYANVAAQQQLGVIVDEGPGWKTALVIAAILAVLGAVYVASQNDEMVLSGQSLETDRATTADVIGAGLASFVVLLITLRAFFALLNIESALRR